MTFSDEVRGAIEGATGRIRSVAPVGGGCISETYRVDTEGGAVFVKHHPAAPDGMFAAEAEGLRALRSAAGEALRVPEVIAMDGAARGAKWLALEWLEPAPRGRDYDERLGRGLAVLHARGGEGWGWPAPSYIGSLPQENTPAETWPAFWRDRRLLPQLRLAAAAGRAPGAAGEWERLFARLPELLAAGEADGPSLVHGDLWSGNVLATGAGPALIDPAVYRGHREVDLAMMELFGGFDPRVLAAYEEARPLLPGYGELRRGIYQLYFLLVHVTLFGGGYAARTATTLRRVLAG